LQIKHFFVNCILTLVYFLVGRDKTIPVSFKRVRHFDTRIIAGLNITKTTKRLVNSDIDLVKTGATVARDKPDRAKLTDFGEMGGTLAG
jgi:hypothetical protein